MKISVLVENSALPGFSSVHGLSLLVESKKRDLLFDMGPDKTFLSNAERLGRDISKVDVAAISHGHQDHGGALDLFLQENKKALVYVGCGAFEPHLSKREEEEKASIGLDRSFEGNSRIRFVDDVCKIEEGVFLVRGFDDSGFIPEGNKRLYAVVEEKIVFDDFSHELMLCVVEEGDMVVFTGCSHSGITNMIKRAVDLFPEVRLKAVVGGMHLWSPRTRRKESDKAINDLAESLSALDEVVFYTGHCTGDEGFRMLSDVLGERVKRLSSGMVFEL